MVLRAHNSMYVNLCRFAGYIHAYLFHRLNGEDEEDRVCMCLILYWVLAHAGVNVLVL